MPHINWRRGDRPRAKRVRRATGRYSSGTGFGFEKRERAWKFRAATARALIRVVDGDDDALFPVQVRDVLWHYL